MFPKCLKLVFGFSTLDQVRRTEQAALRSPAVQEQRHALGDAASAFFQAFLPRGSYLSAGGDLCIFFLDRLLPFHPPLSCPHTHTETHTHPSDCSYHLLGELPTTTAIQSAATAAGETRGLCVTACSGKKRFRCSFSGVFFRLDRGTGERHRGGGGLSLCHWGCRAGKENSRPLG